MIGWIRKHQWSCLAMIIFFILCCGLAYLYTIYPRYEIASMDNVELGTDLNTYIKCDNCDDITYEIVDEHGDAVQQFNVNESYRCKIVFHSEWIHLPIDKSVRYVDTTPPEIKKIEDSIELEWDENFDLNHYLEIVDNSNGTTRIDMVESYNPSIIDQLQIVEFNVCDQSNNCTASSVAVTHHAPQCGENALFDGQECVCLQGYEGDPFSGCTVIAIQNSVKTNYVPQITTSPEATSPIPESTLAPNPTNQSESTPTSQPNVDGWSEPEWGYSIDVEGTESLNMGVDACVAAGEADYGKPDNATGYACLTQGNGYTLTWFDADGNAVASIGGY